MSKHRLLIRHADVVFPDKVAKTNVLIEEGKIVAVDAAADQPADEAIDAAGLTLLPGVVDDQVHFRDPGGTHKEDIESGSIACAAGGVTTFLEMPNTSPPAIAAEALAKKYQRGSQVSRVNYGFYIGATGHNVAELQAAHHAPGIKIFIGSSTGDLLVDEQEALERIFAETSLPICAHCEDETTVRANRAALGDSLTIHDHSRIRDHAAALIATTRAVELAKRHQHRFHVLHVSTAGEIPVVSGGDPYITSEVCPHHLFFSIDDYDRLGSLVQMNPSVKSPEDTRLLWDALTDGKIQVLATDHAPHLLSEKQAAYPDSPSGLPAVENSLALMLNQVHLGRCRLTQVASWMSDAPARVWDLVGKGRISVGYDADLVLVDLQQERTIRNADQKTRCGWSPWDGQTLTGWPVRTIVGGQTVYVDGTLVESVRGRGVLCDHARGGYWATPDGIGY
ncbi:dihydroorotase [Aureliella helgolandensis]|uniref:Allantoinase n=1 Tax=Aureliella helgolandensis TaxID=2527968 RepID=A0A518G0L0_9BACT|nr:dihydroorotase [Aureliella helgolandensis]QDV22141.1 Allantoinase [Aureliella helgolandensis]